MEWDYYSRLYHLSIQLFQWRLLERMANGPGECRTEVPRPKGTVVTLFDMWICKISLVAFTLRGNEYTNYKRLFDSKDKRNSRFSQLKEVPGFLVWTAYCLRLCIASHKKILKYSAQPFFQKRPRKIKPQHWMLKNMDKPYNTPSKVFTKWSWHHWLA